MDNALSDDLRNDGADDEHHAKQQQDAEAWSVGLDLSSDEIEQERIKGFEQGRKDQKRGPRRDQYNEPRERCGQTDAKKSRRFLVMMRGCRLSKLRYRWRPFLVSS